MRSVEIKQRRERWTSETAVCDRSLLERLGWGLLWVTQIRDNIMTNAAEERLLRCHYENTERFRKEGQLYRS